MKSRGFTLMELSVVLTIMSILVATAVPVYSMYVHRARGAEAFLQLETIAYLEEVRVLELGAPIALPPNPIPMPGPTPARLQRHPAWADLGFRTDGRLYFQYRVDLEGDDHFKATALGQNGGDRGFTRITLTSRDFDIRREVNVDARTLQ